MKRSFFLALTFLVWASCSGEKLTVNKPPPAPSPAATPAAEPPAEIAVLSAGPASVEPPARIALETEQNRQAALELEASLRAPDDESAGAGPADPLAGAELAWLEAPAPPADPSAALDPDQVALEAEEGALMDELAEEAIPADADISEVRAIRLRNTKSDMPLTLNPQVAGLIKYFTEGRGKGTLRATLGRSGAYREMIERVLEEEDVPLELFHLAQAESGFHSKARSYARATGMWQFMAFRGKQYGLRQDRYVEERYDPEKAARAAARHLKDLYIEFGDWYLALAAYNSGPGRVSRAIERGKTRDYWELSRRRLLPRQTRNYVPIILAMAYADKNLDVYDVGVIDYAPPRRYDTVTISQEVSLELLADIAGTRASELEDLNPALLRSATPPYEYALRVPPGAGEGLRASLAEVPADKRMQWRRHEVGEGETLEAVAKRWKVKVDALAAVNDVQPGETLTAGLRLNVPTATKLRSFRRWGGAGGLVDDGTGRYRIANGDTLGAIARRFGVSVAQLRTWNGLPNVFIRAGRYLIVRPTSGSSSGGATTRASSSAGPAPSGRYRVRSGDTLDKIARRHGTSVSRLMAWNGLRSSRIQVGQTLKTPGSSSASSSSSSAPAGPGRYRIRSGDSLDAISKRFGVEVADLKAWNGLRSSRIRAGKYLRVRPGTSAAPSSASSAGAGASSYRVRPGDNLAVIARRHGVTVRRIQQWNGLSSTRIRAGQTLIVGGSGEPAPASPVAPSEAPRQASQQAPPARPSGESRYRIRTGDTLGHIADRFGVTASDLRRWNGMRGSRISAGKYLVVRPPPPPPAVSTRAAASAPAAAPVLTATSTAPASGRYRIQAGDTLGGIADKFGVGVSELRAWNGMRGSRISAGKYLVVKPPTAQSGGQGGGQGGRYRIQSGDTLETIARRFGVSIDDLKAWNGLRSTRIRAGNHLNVRPAGAGGGE